MKWNFAGLFVGVLALLQCACATRWTEADRGSIAGVKVAAPSVAKKAFNTPVMAVSGETTESAASFGLAGMLIGATIDGAVMNDFNKENAAGIRIIRANTPANLPNEVRDAFLGELQKSPVFAPKLKSEGVHQFQVEVMEYMLKRVGGQRDFSPVITAKFKLVSPQNKPAWQTFAGYAGYMNKAEPWQASFEQYVARPELLREHYQSVAREVARQAFNNLTLRAH